MQWFHYMILLFKHNECSLFLSAMYFWPCSAQNKQFWSAVANWHLKPGQKGPNFLGAPKSSPFLIIPFLALLLNFLLSEMCCVFVCVASKQKITIPRLLQLAFKLGVLLKRRVFHWLQCASRISLSSHKSKWKLETPPCRGWVGKQHEWEDSLAPGSMFCLTATNILKWKREEAEPVNGQLQCLFRWDPRKCLFSHHIFVPGLLLTPAPLQKWWLGHHYLKECINFVKLPDSLPSSSANPPRSFRQSSGFAVAGALLLPSMGRSTAVPGVPVGPDGNRHSLLGCPAEKVQTLIFCCQDDISAVVLMPVFFLMCVRVSSSLLQVHLCPLYPFLLFRLSSWFLPAPSRATHAAFSWIILSVPVLGSGWFCLVASPLPSISLASFGFNTF